MKMIAIGLMLLMQFTPWANQIDSPSWGNIRNWATQSEQSALAEPLALQKLPVKLGTGQLELAATSALAIDVDSAQVLYSKNAEARLPIASITKLITALVIIDGHSLDKVVTVPTLPAYLPEEVKMGLTAGQQFSVRSLLTASLIPSYNDAADTLAIYDSGSTTQFAAKMNRYIKQWGITDCAFHNANGLGDNFASAQSLAKLAKIALANDFIREQVARRSAQIQDNSGKIYQLATTNRLLGGGRFIGFKTGYTPSAGQSFVGLAKADGHLIVTVVLNSPDRFAESQQLLSWVEESYQWL
jgi:D-alanyl-D-alanine carboxypeptidase (penicillin-binding protein 5/6)